MADYTKPLPIPDIDSQPFWDRCKAHELSAQRCGDCGKFRWPPQAFCPHCYSWKFDWTKLERNRHRVFFRGRALRVDSCFQGDVPYVVAHITLDNTDDQITMISNVIQCPWQEVRIGMPVRLVFEDVTSEVTLPKFRPM